MSFLNTYAAVSGMAGSQEVDGYKKINFFIRNAVTFIANDSETHSLLVNMNGRVGEAGTFELKPGEVLSDLYTTCDELYVQGIGGAVPFRAVGS